MNAQLHFDDDLTGYLHEQAAREHTTLDAVPNRLLRRVVPIEPPATGSSPAWIAELRTLREQCSTGKAGTSVERLIDEIRS